jgi:hypothetical protein
VMLVQNSNNKMMLVNTANKCCPFDEDRILTTAVALDENQHQVLINDCGNVLTLGFSPTPCK